jgi:hypothetical protein
MSIAAQARLRFVEELCEVPLDVAAPMPVKDWSRRRQIPTGPLPNAPARPCQETGNEAQEIETGSFPGNVGSGEAFKIAVHAFT